MSRWTMDEYGAADSWDDHYDDALDPGLPLRNGLLVKTWEGVYRPGSTSITEPISQTLNSLSESAYVGLIVESKLIGKDSKPGMQYWRYLINWPDGLVWEDTADLVMEHDWNKTYYEWLREGADDYS